MFGMVLRAISLVAFMYVADRYGWVGALACLPPAFAIGWFYGRWANAREPKKRY